MYVQKKAISGRPDHLNRGLGKYNCGYDLPASTDLREGLQKMAGSVKAGG